MSHLVWAIAVIIFLAPFLLTLPFFWDRFNYTTTGQIGDTIGGLTSPFINGLAAILVFVTFREQVRANALLQSQEASLRNQEQARNILEQINGIQQTDIDINVKTTGITNRIGILHTGQYDATLMELLQTELFLLSEFRLAQNLLDQYPGNKRFLYRKLNSLYWFRYKIHFDRLRDALVTEIATQVVSVHYTNSVNEIVTQTNQLNQDFEHINRYDN